MNLTAMKFDVSTLAKDLEECHEVIKKAKWKRESLQAKLDALSSELESIQTEIDLVDKERKLLIDVSDWTREQTLKQCNELLSHALQYIFDKEVSCKAVLSEKYGKPYLDFVITSYDGALEVVGSPEDTRGGSVSETLALVLQILLDRKGPFIIDEKTKSINNEYLPRVYEFLKDVCRSMNVQMIVVTHSDYLIESGDRIFEAVRVGEFVVREQKR